MDWMPVVAGAEAGVFLGVSYVAGSWRQIDENDLTTKFNQD
jgi:hypothetical protein